MLSHSWPTPINLYPCLWCVETQTITHYSQDDNSILAVHAVESWSSLKAWVSTPLVQAVLSEVIRIGMWSCILTYIPNIVTVACIYSDVLTPPWCSSFFHPKRVLWSFTASTTPLWNPSPVKPLCFSVPSQYTAPSEIAKVCHIHEYGV